MNKHLDEPAFPVTTEQSPTGSFPMPGMTLRDYFAAKAMQGYLVQNSRRPDELIAKDSYNIADAMLRERSK